MGFGVHTMSIVIKSSLHTLACQTHPRTCARTHAHARWGAVRSDWRPEASVIGDISTVLWCWGLRQSLCWLYGQFKGAVKRFLWVYISTIIVFIICFTGQNYFLLSNRLFLINITVGAPVVCSSSHWVRGWITSWRGCAHIYTHGWVSSQPNGLHTYKGFWWVTTLM